MRALAVVLACSLFVISCGSSPKPAESAPAKPAAAAPAEPPPDESPRFTKANLTGTEVVQKGLLGHEFMPGGTLARYKAGSKTYEMFVAKTASPTAASTVLLDWKRVLTGARFVASFGGYFGQDNGTPVFVFTKNRWIAGVKGLPLADADREARTLASRLD